MGHTSHILGPCLRTKFLGWNLPSLCGPPPSFTDHCLSAAYTLLRRGRVHLYLLVGPFYLLFPVTFVGEPGVLCKAWLLGLFWGPSRGQISPGVCTPSTLRPPSCRMVHTPLSYISGALVCLWPSTITMIVLALCGWCWSPLRVPQVGLS